MSIVNTGCCKLLLDQMDTMEIILKSLKEMNRQYEDILPKKLVLSSLESSIVDVMEQIEYLDIKIEESE